MNGFDNDSQNYSIYVIYRIIKISKFIQLFDNRLDFEKVNDVSIVSVNN